MKGKTNPTKLPATQADVKRAKREGHNEGARFMAGLFIMTLRDKKSEVFTEQDLNDTWVAIKKLMEEVTEGRVKGTDVLNALHEEGIIIQIG